MPGWQPKRSQPPPPPPPPPERTRHWLEHPVSDRKNDGHLQRIGGVKAGYAGHIPESQMPPGQSPYGITRGCAAQRGHERSKLNYFAKDAPSQATRRAVSLPGYRGHLPGDQESFGTSPWSPNRGDQRFAAEAGSQSARNTSRTPRTPRGYSSSPSARGAASWTLSSWTYGTGGEEPGSAPAPVQATGKLVRPPEVRDPHKYATKTVNVRQITSTLSGPAETWVPPAGLYAENSKREYNFNMWALKEGKEGEDALNIAPRYTPRRWTAAPMRDAGLFNLNEKHVDQHLASALRGPKETWYPPAGLYVENSKESRLKKGMGIDMWKVKDGTLNDKPPPREYIKPPAVRDPDECVLEPRHVEQITMGMRGPAESWKPPAGLCIENSKKGIGMNLWDLRRSKSASVVSNDSPSSPDPTTNLRYGVPQPLKSGLAGGLPSKNGAGLSEKARAKLAEALLEDVEA